MDKPTKPTNLMPRSFGGTKNNWSSSMQESGYEDGIPAIYGGDNLNYQLDATGKELEYCEKFCDFINEIPIGKTITVDSNNKLVYGDFSLPDATTTTKGGVIVGSGLSVNSAVLSVPDATTTTKGIVRPDNTTITISNGVITAHGDLIISSVVGSTWYRLYADGWKECGGIVATSQSEINWTQPYLNGNGTLGGASFAIQPSSEFSDTYAAWKAFDGNTTGNQYAGWRTKSMTKGYTHDIIIYNPTAIKLSQISYLNYDQTVLAPVSGTVYGSDDNSSWVEITTYTNSVTASGSTWYIDVSNNTNYYKYYKITFKNGASAGYIWCTEIGLTATYLGAYGNAITFPISFSNTNYSFALGFVGSAGGNIYVSNKTTTGMTLSASPIGTCYWTAKGF